MTGAGIASLLLCRQLSEKQKLPASCVDELTATITRALERTGSFRTNLAGCAS